MGKDKKIRTRNIFMLKKIVDDDNVEGGLIMVGTFIQQVFGLTEEQVKEKFVFAYRFNENSATDDSLQKRRTEPLIVKEVIDGKEETILGTRTTYQARIPLDIDTMYSRYPFSVYTATATIELSSDNLEDGITLRPDLLLHNHDSRNNVSIQNLKLNINDALLMDATKGKTIKQTNITEKVQDKIDKSKKYDFLSPYPKVFYEYERKKDYCPRFVISFYVVTSGFQKLVSVILPLVLVTFIAGLNVWNDSIADNDTGNSTTSDAGGKRNGEAAADHLAITSALTLTTVFLLPQMIDSANRNDLLSQDNLYIIIIFVSLMLTSIPQVLAGTIALELIGVCLMIFSYIMPIYSIIKYTSIIRNINDEVRLISKCKRFLSDKDYKQWKEKNGLGEFSTVGEIVNNEDFKNNSCTFNNLYKVRGEELCDTKYVRLWWNIPTTSKKSN